MKSIRSVLSTCTFFCAALCAQEARLSNLAIRAQGGGGDVLITGFAIGPGSSKTVLVRAVGPTLGGFGVGGTLSDPRLELYSGDRKIAENDDWNAADASTFSSVGAFALGPASKDAALVATLTPGSYTAQVTGVGDSAGVALIEVYEVTGGTTRLINVSTRAHVGTGGNILIPGITIAPGAGSRRLLIRAIGPTLGAFGVAGTIEDPKLELYSGSTKVAENDDWGTAVGTVAASATALGASFSQAGAFPLSDGSKDAALLVSLSPGSYTLQVSGVANTTGAALVEVYDLTPENQTGAQPNASLYVARLRPDSAAASSLGSGYATIAINPNGTATVNVSFSNLSSEQVSTYLNVGASGDHVLNLPRGQVTNGVWTFSPSGAHTTNDLIHALNNGNIFVSLNSARYPGGELRGNFVRAAGSQTFTPPRPPPALAADALTKPNPTDAARFLTQATFGPTTAEIEALINKGIPRWLDEQMAAPMSSHLSGLRADGEAFPNPPSPSPSQTFFKFHGANRLAAWWKIVLTGDDQLRQRVAFALSNIFVVSDFNTDIWDRQEALAQYNDLLARHAFGNFRQLLDDVTLNPLMGVWLTHLRNQKADPVKGTAPDENYARELQQLFTIGLVQLHPDGTLLLDSGGQPIPTYDQAIVSETAKILTGWAFANVPRFDADPPGVGVTRINGVSDDSGWLNPMAYHDAFHDKSTKNIVSLRQVPLAEASRIAIPANQTGPQDLKILLDTLFNHPNTGPFVCKQLIQRLVTSNPSPAYVYRVGQIFANDGSGTRGNLGAVVRAILTDYEARSADVVGNIGYGKIKEPLLRWTALLRATNARAPNGRFIDSYFGDPLGNGWTPSSGMLFVLSNSGQAPLSPPTVFNFFSPDFSPPGTLASAGLVSPEMQITDSYFSTSLPNTLWKVIYRSPTPPSSPPAPSPSPYIALDFSEFAAVAKDAPALTAKINLLFCANQMSDTTRDQILATIRLITRFGDTAIAQAAIYLAVSSPDGALQK